MGHSNLSMETYLLLAPIFFIIALFYAIAGFGGGSTYLAILVLFAVPYESIPKIALLCNLIVAGGGFIYFYQHGFFSWARVLPFAIVSIPLAYLGGYIPINKEHFLLLLGITLAIASLRLFFIEHQSINANFIAKKMTWWVTTLIAAAIGFLSGLVGIGGGIFLSPILYFLNWGSARQIAVAASFFILVNSAAGLLGQLTKSDANITLLQMSVLAIAVLCGGQIGSRLALAKFSPVGLQRVTAVLIFIVAARVLGGVL